VIDLDALERLLAEATPGPWVWREWGIDYGFVGPGDKTTILFGEQSEGAVEADDPDALALVALRNAAPELIALARSADAAYLAGAEAMRERAAACVDVACRCDDGIAARIRALPVRERGK